MSVEHSPSNGESAKKQILDEKIRSRLADEFGVGQDVDKLADSDVRKYVQDYCTERMREIHSVNPTFYQAINDAITQPLASSGRKSEIDFYEHGFALVYGASTEDETKYLNEYAANLDKTTIESKKDGWTVTVKNLIGTTVMERAVAPEIPLEENNLHNLLTAVTQKFNETEKTAILRGGTFAYSVINDDLLPPKFARPLYEGKHRKGL